MDAPEDLDSSKIAEFLEDIQEAWGRDQGPVKG